MTTSSARKGPAAGGAAGPSVISRFLPYGLIGIGAIGLVLGLVTKLGGTSMLHGSLQPETAGSSSVYTARTVDLERGLYDVSLSVRGARSVLGMGFGFTLTAPENPGFRYSGRLKQRKRSGNSSSSSRRRYASTSILVEVADPGPHTLVFTFDGGLDRTLDVGVRSVYADFRFPMYGGMLLVALGLVLSPDLRARLGELSARFGKS